MWTSKELEKLKEIGNSSQLESFLVEAEIEAIRGTLSDGKYTNNSRYLNLRNTIFCHNKFTTKVIHSFIHSQSSE